MSEATQDRHANARSAIKQTCKQDGINCPNEALGGGRRYAEQRGRQKRVEDCGSVHAGLTASPSCNAGPDLLLGPHPENERLRAWEVPYRPQIPRREQPQ